MIGGDTVVEMKLVEEPHLVRRLPPHHRQHPPLPADGTTVRWRPQRSSSTKSASSRRPAGIGDPAARHMFRLLRPPQCRRRWKIGAGVQRVDLPTSCTGPGNALAGQLRWQFSLLKFGCYSLEATLTTSRNRSGGYDTRQPHPNGSRGSLGIHNSRHAGNPGKGRHADSRDKGQHADSRDKGRHADSRGIRRTHGIRGELVRFRREKNCCAGCSCRAGRQEWLGYWPWNQ